MSPGVKVRIPVEVGGTDSVWSGAAFRCDVGRIPLGSGALCGL